ncbi:hypothetical protein E1A91_D01G158200v1 [Gossypium mustelinum]|uniref:Uncharacterized protein n=1 Tax=Gossypium mustelinum TaxID=34275 RepID=A0A5D2W759_GOSMU|nr:hypothetical protein E1A91_D01G158200v1 [Gossypium mustelinum]
MFYPTVAFHTIVVFHTAASTPLQPSLVQSDASSTSRPMCPSVRTRIPQQQVCRLLCHTPSCTIRRLR